MSPEPAEPMAVETTGALPAVPGSGAGGLPPWQPQRGKIGPLQVTPLDILPPSWHVEKTWRPSGGLLKELGAFHIILATLHLILGLYLVFVVKDLHLVVLKSWYPFWGAASFLASGILAIVMTTCGKKFVRSLCLASNLVSFFCVLSGLVVLIKDLFVENPFATPIWRPYPNTTVHIQRLELTLLCFTYLELFLPGPTAMVAWRFRHLSAEMDALYLVPDPPLELHGVSVMAPPTYEELVKGSSKAEQE